MKSVGAFLSQLDELGIQVLAEGGRLRCSAPEGVLTQNLVGKLEERKAEILDFLEKTDPCQDLIKPVSKGMDIPLSFAQQRLWFLDQLEKGGFAYNMTSAMRLTGYLDRAALQWTLDEIVSRHEILRTTFPMKNGSPVQSVKSDPHLKLATMDLCHIREPGQSSAVRRFVDNEARRAFDLENGPLVCVTLIKLGETSHVLILNMHHIVTDGWSVGIIVRELSALYNAYTGDRHISLPELPVQYADFACWQNGWLQGDVLQKQLRFWKNLLNGAPDALDLPSRKVRPAVQSYRGKSRFVKIDSDLKKALADLGQTSGATMFMILLSAFATLLFRYTGQKDIVIGAPIANRNRSEIENLIGFFANTLALRFDFSDVPTFATLSGRVRDMMTAAYEHQDLPFEKLVEELHPGRDLSRNPLVQVVFALQNSPLHTQTPEIKLKGLAVEPVTFESGAVRFDLEVHVWESPNDFVVEFIYNTDLFDPDAIERMGCHYRTLLASIVASPETPVSRLPLLPTDERQRLLVSWNDTRKPYSREKCIHHVVEAHARQRPDAVALVFEGRRVTYGALNRKANQLAHRLQRLGVRPDTLVGICVERSVDMVVGLLGILKAGGAYVPLDPTYPAERLVFMMKDSNALVLITTASIFGPGFSASGNEASVICLDEQNNSINRESKDNPVSQVTSENLAYVIYTSGSTGRPKGVQVKHHSVINLLEAVHPLLKVDDRDIWTVFHSFAFDLSVWEIWSPLLSGATLVIVPRRFIHDPEAFYRLLTDERVTVLNQTPSFMSRFVQTKQFVDGQKQGRALPPDLRLLICGGEALAYPLAAQLTATSVATWNFYGPTEATVWVAVKKIDCVESQNGVVPIGRPIANTQIYILDAHLEPVPTGVIGDLYIAGECLARGYLNRPGLTAEKFVENPFSGKNGNRLYNTGDLACLTPDGDIEFFGRKDHQVKIRGYRIELGEIETVLAGHQGVRDAVVIVREDQPDDHRLTAYVVQKKAGRLTPGDLRTFLGGKLPMNMMPSDIVFLETLPLTPNGKVDRRALPAPHPAYPRREAGGTSPRNAMERGIAKVWREVLRIEDVGVHDNFFDLGGHSFLMIRIHNRLKEIYDHRVSMMDLFRYPTVSALADFLSREREVKPCDIGRVHERLAKQKQAVSVHKKLMAQRKESFK